jgi:hypothetical protein
LENYRYSNYLAVASGASKTPFVTVACGNAEEIVNSGHGGIIAPATERPNGMVNAKQRSTAEVIEELIRNPDDGSSLGEAG